MSLDIFGLIIDFGLVVLVLIVQLVIYPSFKYYSRPDLDKWHTRYTGRITIIVLPLMTCQLGMGVYRAFADLDIYVLAALFLILFTWIATFALFVPLHGKISSGNYTLETIERMIRLNWLRTVAWTLLFGLSLMQLWGE